LIKAKLEDGPIKPREVITPPPLIDLMAALKPSLAPDTPSISGTTGQGKRAKPKTPIAARAPHVPCGV